jgi:hypothetical protein
MRSALVLVLFASTAWADPPDGGASVSVVVEPNGDTTVDVRKGTVKLKAGGSEERVGAGETVRVQKGKRLQRMLAAPAPMAPADEATLNNTDVALAWKPVAGASRSVVEIASAPEMVGVRTSSVTGTRAVVHLEPGTWYWRVVALDGGGAAGKRAAARRLTIDTTPPKLKTGKPEWR